MVAFLPFHIPSVIHALSALETMLGMLVEVSPAATDHTSIRPHIIIRISYVKCAQKNQKKNESNMPTANAVSAFVGRVRG